MPNWCSNSLVLRHEDPAMVQRAYKAFAEGRFCAEFVPVPEELQGTSSPNRDEKQAEALLEKYGYADWYSFQVNEWGTKWDFGSGDGINEVTDQSLTVYFDSAWSPPVVMMARLEEMGFEVDLMYYEPGMAFCGRYSDGCDDYYEYGGATAAEIAQTIPADIDEAFSISENVAAYEDEEE